MYEDNAIKLMSMFSTSHINTFLSHFIEVQRYFFFFGTFTTR